MSRYIDADVLRETIEFCHYFGDDGITFNASEKEALMQIIDGTPTIDAVEVVRCKECRHNPKYTHDYMYGQCVCCCEDDEYSWTPEDDDFCSYGERKETDHE